MSFLTPGFLALAALAVPIIVLYMLRLRRREVPVSSTMLWQRLMQDREANAPWQRLRRNLLLLLQLLILAMLVVALGRPYLPVPSVAAGSVALVMDASASMLAEDMPGGATRFAAAQDRARALVAELGSNEVMTVIAAGAAPQVLTPPTNDRAALREAINRAAAEPAAADWGAALALAGASIAGREDAAIVILSDGGLPDDLPAVPADVRYVQVGRSAENLAISALAIRPLEGVPQLFAAVTNTGTQPAETILSLEVDGALTGAERLTVPPGETVTHTVADLPAETRTVRAEISAPAGSDASDALPTDDVAYAAYTPATGGRVLLVSAGNLFLEQVLASLPGIEAYRVDPGDLPEEPFDLVILDGWLPDELPDTNLLLIRPPESTDLFTVGEPFTDTRFVRQADHPALSFVDFRDVAVREAVTVATTGWGRTLVETEGGPLLLAGTTGGRRIALLTFDLRDSDLPLQIAFPILFANLLDWYAPTQPFEAGDALQPGQPVVIRPQASTTGYAVTLPDGERQVFPLDADAPTFTRTSQPGIYRVELLDGDRTTAEGAFAVNLFAPGESAIAPREAITIGQAAVQGTGEGDELGQRELWPTLAVAALALLALEWWAFHRGTALRRGERDRDGRVPLRQRLGWGRRG